MKVKTVTFSGLAIALLAVSAWISIPLGPVPFTLQTAVLILVVLLGTPTEVLVSVVGYLVLGAIGLPVFSGGTGGIGILFGPTGGFLIGFLLGAILALLIRFLCDKFGVHALLKTIFATLAVCVSIYTLGLLQLSAVANMSLSQAFVAGVAPFIIPDAIKAILAAAVARSISRIAIRREVAEESR